MLRKTFAAPLFRQTGLTAMLISRFSDEAGP